MVKSFLDMARPVKWKIRESVLISGQKRWLVNVPASHNRGVRARLSFRDRSEAELFISKHRARSLQPPLIQGRRIGPPSVRQQGLNRWVVDVPARVMELNNRPPKRIRKGFTDRAKACRWASERCEEARHAQSRRSKWEINSFQAISAPREDVEVIAAKHAYRVVPGSLPSIDPNLENSKILEVASSLREIGVDLRQIGEQILHLRTGSLEQVDLWKKRLSRVLEDLDLIEDPEFAMRPRAIEVIFRIAFKACNQLASLASHSDPKIAHLVQLLASKSYYWPLLISSPGILHPREMKILKEKLKLGSKVKFRPESQRGRSHDLLEGSSALALKAYSTLEEIRHRFKQGTIKERRREKNQYTGWRRSAVRLPDLSSRTIKAWITTALEWINGLSSLEEKGMISKLLANGAKTSDRSDSARLKQLLRGGFLSILRN